MRLPAGTLGEVKQDFRQLSSRETSRLIINRCRCPTLYYLVSVNQLRLLSLDETRDSAMKLELLPETEASTILLHRHVDHQRPSSRGRPPGNVMNIPSATLLS